MIELISRTNSINVDAHAGLSLLDHSVKYDGAFTFSCTRGTCARCRCLVLEGAEFLEEVTDAEWDRMDEEEFAQGYRLACQAIVKDNPGTIRVQNVPYF